MISKTKIEEKNRVLGAFEVCRWLVSVGEHHLAREFLTNMKGDRLLMLEYIEAFSQAVTPLDKKSPDMQAFFVYSEFMRLLKDVFDKKIEL